MKTLTISLLTLLICLPLSAQSDVVEIPTEVSQPPYAIGNLVVEQGYYIERAEDQTRINVRIVGNKLHIYWIDENGLIAEPEHPSAVVRFIGSVRGRAYHGLSLLPEGSGLGAPGIIVPPHLYNTILVFPASEGEEPITHSFRYTPLMDVPVDPTVDSES